MPLAAPVISTRFPATDRDSEVRRRPSGVELLIAIRPAHLERATTTAGADDYLGVARTTADQDPRPARFTAAIRKT